MSEQNLFQERVQLFRDATRFKKINRIPNISNFTTWQILDSDTGYKLSEAMKDWNKMHEVVLEFHKRYNFDGYTGLGTRNPIGVTDALGVSMHEVDDEKEIVNHRDHAWMNGDEYKEYSEDSMKYFWTKVLPRKYPDMSMDRMKNCVAEYMAFVQYNQKILETLAENQVPNLFDMVGVILHPFEKVFNYLRGIKGVSLDLRRHKSEIIETMEMKYQQEIVPVLDLVCAQDNENLYPFDVSAVFLGHSVLSTKQFGEIYWPHFKKIIDKLAENNKTMFLGCESDMMRFVEYFQDVPKGVLTIHLELDNIFEMRKKLPNICFAGGMTTDLLGYGTKEQCVDYSKKLLDELGRDGGFIFSQNKIVSYRNDCKRENLLAVNEFVRNYRV